MRRLVHHGAARVPQASGPSKAAAWDWGRAAFARGKSVQCIALKTHPSVRGGNRGELGSEASEELCRAKSV